MTLLLALACGVLGLLIGSFVNVVAWRVPRGESVVHPGSHCPSCDSAIRARDNVPVLSWLLLRGRCRDCRAGISARYPAVELLTGLVFAVLAARLGASAALPAFLYLGAIGVALAVIDLDTHRLPDKIVLPSYLVAGGLLVAAALLQGDPRAAVRTLAGAAAAYLFFFVIRVVQPRGMGGGDVKLAGVLGLYLGYLGWRELVLGTFAAFLIGGIFGLGLLATGRAKRKSQIPFGPFMLTGALVAVLVAAPLARAYLRVSGV